MFYLQHNESVEIRNLNIPSTMKIAFVLVLVLIGMVAQGAKLSKTNSDVQGQKDGFCSTMEASCNDSGGHFVSSLETSGRTADCENPETYAFDGVCETFPGCSVTLDANTHTCSCPQ
ncbi:uncharacterized protein LOC110861647 [Folsomia candida]|uniref:Uncharacterized protein n=1 Tax=Folsomia candida TaxID=158441 RepID=A0A226D227_FOLCA|nr:uncharacterized protein LOC110861647 [Folsomia candida]OXA38868.1 hypothetical protein Fcan01_26354 [Folsomia candida]